MRAHVVGAFVDVAVAAVAVGHERAEERLEIDGDLGRRVLLQHEARRRVVDKDRGEPFVDTRALDEFGDPTGDVVHAPTGRGEREALAKDDVDDGHAALVPVGRTPVDRGCATADRRGAVPAAGARLVAHALRAYVDSALLDDDGGTMTDIRFALQIDGMHCGGCVRRVHKALGDVPGVTIEAVDVGTASGSFDADDTDVDELLAAVARLGFVARPAPAGR